MNNYIILLKKLEDNTIEIRLELIDSSEVFYCKINDGEIIEGNINEDRKEIPDIVFEKIDQYKEFNKVMIKLNNSEKLKITERSYKEQYTIGQKSDWRFSANKEVTHRKIAEITFIENITKKEFIFHYDALEKAYRYFYIEAGKKLDVTNLIKDELIEKTNKHFMSSSKYRMKLIYLKNYYR